MRDAVRAAALRAAVPRRRAPLDGTVAITFDDGPDEHFTPRVLDVLAARGAQATFFLVGRRAERHPALVRRMVADGHVVGSHTHTHPEVYELPARALLAECRRGRAAVERAAGVRARAFRAPKGHWSPKTAIIARGTGLVPWHWSLDPADWRADATPGAILYGLRALGSRDVILLHDAIASPESPGARDRTATLTALPHILDLANARGLRPIGLTAS